MHTFSMELQFSSKEIGYADFIGEKNAQARCEFSMRLLRLRAGSNSPSSDMSESLENGHIGGASLLRICFGFFAL
jgi:hypothetical protein